MLDRPAIEALLADLAAELPLSSSWRSGRHVHRRWSGHGACLRHPSVHARRRWVFEPKAVIYEAAAVVAERRGLPEDWLKDAVKGFLPGEDAAAQVAFDDPHLRVLVASPRYLLAMKLLAARVDVDQDDIVALYALCGFTTADEGLDLLAATYPTRPVAPRVQFLLEELFPSR